MSTEINLPCFMIRVQKNQKHRVEKTLCFGKMRERSIFRNDNDSTRRSMSHATVYRNFLNRTSICLWKRNKSILCPKPGKCSTAIRAIHAQTTRYLTMFIKINASNTHPRKDKTAALLAANQMRVNISTGNDHIVIVGPDAHLDIDCRYHQLESENAKQINVRTYNERFFHA